MLRLETERLVLRSLEDIDAPRIRLLAGDYSVAANTLTTPHPYPDGAAEAFIANARTEQENGTAYIFVIVPRSEGILAGLIGLHLTPAHQRGDIGYWMGAEYRGCGYTTEALRRVIRFGFEELDLNRITAGCFGENTASERVIQKAGMKFEGRFRNHYLRFGKFHDTLCYALLREEWHEAL